MPDTSSGFTSWATTGVPASSRRRRKAAASVAPSTAIARPSTPARASAMGVPRRGRGSSRTRPAPTADWPASHAASACDPLAGMDLDPGGVGDRGGQRASGGLRAPVEAGRRGPLTPYPPVSDPLGGRRPAPGARPRRSRGRAGDRRLRSGAEQVGGPPAGGPCRTGDARGGHGAVVHDTCSASAVSPAVSPVMAGRRSIRERNSNSRKSRMTVSRS